jgi:hypothetical protein
VFRIVKNPVAAKPRKPRARHHAARVVRAKKAAAAKAAAATRKARPKVHAGHVAPATVLAHSSADPPPQLAPPSAKSSSHRLLELVALAALAFAAIGVGVSFVPRTAMPNARAIDLYDVCRSYLLAFGLWSFVVAAVLYLLIRTL